MWPEEKQLTIFSFTYRLHIPYLAWLLCPSNYCVYHHSPLLIITHHILWQQLQQGIFTRLFITQLFKLYIKYAPPPLHTPLYVEQFFS